jgi:hypothetical protein
VIVISIRSGLKIKIRGSGLGGEKAEHTGSMYAGSGNQVLLELLCNTARALRFYFKIASIVASRK